MTDQTLLSVLETVEFNEEGFMVDPNAWTHEIGTAIASVLNIELTDRHWIVIDFARDEFAANGQAPTLRKITKQTDVKTKELYALFPKGPAKLAAQIAGLGKPKGCI